VIVKPVEFLGSSREDIRSFPVEVRRAVGLELLKAQQGAMPDDFKPMQVIGRGVYEIRVRIEGAWRVLYVSRDTTRVWVLHAFQKKTQRTSKLDIEIGRSRYQLMEDER
jgi:phage-related protein